MKTYISKFSLLLRESLDFIRQQKIRTGHSAITNVVFCGMGSSGIAGKIASEIISGECTVPFTVINDYFLPEFINEHTLVIISSYSGDHEEVLLAFVQAQQKKARIVCIAAGGKLAGLANDNECDLLPIQEGIPVHAAVGCFITRILHVLHCFQLIPGNFIQKSEAAAELIFTEEGMIIDDAKRAAELLHAKIPVIYSAAGTEGVALRFRQQLNEKAGILAWHNVFPEVNHNEIQGWSERNKDIAVICLRNENDYIRTAKSMEIAMKMMSEVVAGIVEVHSKGDSKLERALYLMHWSDWTSFYLSELNGRSSVNKYSPDQLRTEMEKS